MKKFLLTCIILSLAALPLFAHEADMDNTQGLFGLSPEYVHVLLNPLPTYGLIVGIIVLLAGLLLRNIATRNLGLLIVLFCTGIVWATAHFGQHAYNHLYMDLDPEAKKWADIHMDRAESFQWAFYATAVLSFLALIVPKVARPPATSTVPVTAPPGQPLSTSNEPRNVPTTRRKLTTIGSVSAFIVLICAIICFSLGSWISKAGGRIRHPEFRAGPEPTNAPAAHEHHHD